MKTLKVNKYYFHFIIFTTCTVFHLLVNDSISLYTREWDPVARIRIALENQHNSDIFNYLLPSKVWLPFHFYWIRLINLFDPSLKSLIYCNILMTVLSFSFIFEICMPTKKSTRAFVMAFLIICFFNIHTFYLSRVALTEPLVCFLNLLAIYNTLEILKGKNKMSHYLILFIALNFANGIRYESWLLSASLITWLYLKKRSSKISLLAFSLAFLPFCWITFNLCETGVFLKIFEYLVSDYNTHTPTRISYLSEVFPKIPRFFLEVYHLIKNAGWFIASLMIVIMTCFRKNVSKMFIFICLSQPAIYLMLLLGGMLEPDERYLFIPLTFTILLATSMLKYLNSNNYSQSVAIILIVLFSVGYGHRYSLNLSYHLHQNRIALEKGIRFLKKVKPELSAERKLFVARDILMPELVMIELELFSQAGRTAFFLTEDEPVANERNGKQWFLYDKMNLLNNPNLYYLVIPKPAQVNQTSIETYMPDSIYGAFTKVFENKAFLILKRVSLSKVYI